MTTQRTRLESLIKQLTDLLEQRPLITYGREQIASELRRAVIELNELDAGAHWTQAQGETAGNIAQQNLQQATKKNGK
jgi:hypothetical protein